MAVIAPEQADKVLGSPENRPHSLYFDGPHAHHLWNGAEYVKVPGFSTIASAAAPPDFGIPAWWGQGIGTEGVLELVRRGLLREQEDDAGARYLTWNGAPSTKENVVKLLTKEKLTTNHQRDRGANRGTAAHAFIEDYCKTGILPDLEDVDPVAVPYIRSFLLWVQEERPEFLAAEVLVASENHRCAGIYDARIRIGGRTYLADWKTTKRPYTSHHYQLAGYELASVECGFDPTDGQLIVCLDGDGGYPKIEACRATARDFIAARALFESKSKLENKRKWSR